MIGHYTVRNDKRIRVIIDTDAGCEADDPFAIAQALLTPKFIVKAICAEHFAESGSMERSMDVATRVRNLVGSDVPVLRGCDGPIDGPDEAHPPLSEAAAFITDEALREDDHPLFVLCLGAITNVAEALRARPDIVRRMTVVWIGTQNADPNREPIREFNAGNDITAGNEVLASGVKMWLIPLSVYSTMNVSIPELDMQVRPCGELGRWLFQQLVNYNNSDAAAWTCGDGWSLGDCPAVAVAIKPDCGRFRTVPAPVIGPDTVSRFDASRPMVRLYDTVDSRFTLGDLFAKLALFAQAQQ